MFWRRKRSEAEIIAEIRELAAQVPGLVPRMTGPYLVDEEGPGWRWHWPCGHQCSPNEAAIEWKKEAKRLHAMLAVRAATDAARNPPPPHTLVNAIQDGNHKESSERRTATVVRRPATDAATSGEEE